MVPIEAMQCTNRRDFIVQMDDLRMYKLTVL